MARANAYTCALRALNLCDGQVLEEPDNALTKCICRELQRDAQFGDLCARRDLTQRRQKLIERIMAD